MLGASISSQLISVLGSKSVMVPWDYMGIWGIDEGTPLSITSNQVKNNLLSFFVRFNYDWKSRYLLTATMRADGSSKFIKNKWGYFPSASAAWRISDEPFMTRTSSWLSSLKLRLGWGATGNNITQNAYPSNLLYASNQNYAFGNAMTPAIYISQMANRDLNGKQHTKLISELILVYSTTALMVALTSIIKIRKIFYSMLMFHHQ